MESFVSGWDQGLGSAFFSDATRRIFGMIDNLLREPS